MIGRIQTLDDVITFTKQIIGEGTRIHPDDDFHEMTDLETNKPAYTVEEADVRNELMNQCFDICQKEGTDIYMIMLEIYQKETGSKDFKVGSSEEE